MFIKFISISSFWELLEDIYRGWGIYKGRRLLDLGIQRPDFQAYVMKDENPAPKCYPKMLSSLFTPGLDLTERKCSVNWNSGTAQNCLELLRTACNCLELLETGLDGTRLD